MASHSSSFLRNNGLILAFAALMLVSLAGHVGAGWRFDSQERQQDLQPVQSLLAYISGGDFLSSLFENWESEFLQMGLFVLLTVWLRQKGASESRPMSADEEDPPPAVPLSEQPWPMRRGGAWRRLYEHSLSVALLGMFAVSLVLHWWQSWRAHVEDQIAHGQAITPMWHYLWGAQFWFESFQNWQSEFLSVIVLCWLSIYLREKDSPQSKPMTARHSDTGA